MTTPALHAGRARLLAFQGDPALRERHMALAQRSSRVWQSDEMADGAFFEEVVGMPRALGVLLDELPVLLPEPRDMGFSLEWLAVVQAGMDVSAVAASFIAWLLTDEDVGALRQVGDPALRTSIAHVAWLHGQCRRGQPVERAAWAAARRAVTPGDAASAAAVVVAGGALSADAARRHQDGMAATVAADAAWPTATTGSVAVDALRSWLALQEWPVRVEHGYFSADEEAHAQRCEAFMARHSGWIAELRARGESGEQVQALFAQEHPAASSRHDRFMAAREQVLALATMRAADGVVALLQASGGAP